jgi:tRNA threonylcarbamoyl adenosine modification protein (Sua5/YciO/YrdC/YwlC family)
LDDKHNFTLVCRDLSEIANYAKVDKTAYRLIKSLTPGPYTFILPATREVPRRLQNPKRRTIGLRVPENAIAALLLETLAEPIMSSTLIMPGENMPQTDPHEIFNHLKHQVDLVIDGGFCGTEPTTVVDLVGETPVVLRQGKGDIAMFLSE